MCIQMILTCAHRTEWSDSDGCLAMRMKMAWEKRNTNGVLKKKKQPNEQKSEMRLYKRYKNNITIKWSKFKDVL